MNSKDVINGEIEYWVSKTPTLSKLFGEKIIQYFLVLCEIVTENHPSQEKLIMDFISGLALLHYSKPLNAQHEKEFEIRTDPVFDLIMKLLKSDEYRKCLIDTVVTGTRVITVKDVTILITMQEILLYIKSDKSNFPLTTKDIRKIQKEFVRDTRNEYKEDIPQQPEQPSIPEDEQSKREELKSELDKIRSSENLFWKGLPMDKVISHFTVMTTTKSKNGNEFLTTKQLISFLRKGFLNDTTQPKQKINCSNGEKGFVIKRFYELFDIAVAHYGHIQKKSRFIELFIDCFDNWDEKSIPSFFKPGKTINKW